MWPYLNSMGGTQNSKGKIRKHWQDPISRASLQRREQDTSPPYNHYQEIVFGESIENYVSEASSAPVSLWWEQYMSLDTRFKRLIRTLKGDLQEGAQGG